MTLLKGEMRVPPCACMRNRAPQPSSSTNRSTVPITAAAAAANVWTGRRFGLRVAREQETTGEEGKNNNTDRLAVL